MELRHLRYFVAVAEEGSLTRAAARLGLQQPPLGQQIRALEEELGVTLFDRARKRIALNAAGAVFLDEARRLLAGVADAVEHIRRFDLGERGRLAVGFTSSMSLHPLTPRILRAFRDAYPFAELQVQESETYELILALQQRRIDVAFLHLAVAGFAGLASTLLAEEEVFAAVPADHPFARAPDEPMTLGMFAGQNLVVYRRADGPGIFDGFMRAFEAAGVSPVPVDHVRRMIAALNLVAAGRGLTLVPASLCILRRESVVYRALATQALPPLPLYVAHRRDDTLKLVENFLRIVGETARKA